MAAKDIFQGDRDDEFFKKLRVSEMIKITFEDAYRKPGFMYLPTALACAVSSRLRDLCTKETRRAFIIDELIAQKQAFFEENLTMGIYPGMEDLLGSFLKWLYTGVADTERNYCHDLWYFGYRTGAPKFQNAALRTLCLPAKNGGGRNALADMYDQCDFKACWDLAGFEPEEDHGCHLEHNTVYLGNKQMLKFILDFLVYIGMENSHAQQLFHEGGDMALHLAKLLALAPPADGKRLPPWYSDDFDQYLVDEDISKL